MLWLALHFNPLSPDTLENLAAWACQFTPRVSLEPPQALVAEVAGSLRYFGGLERFLARLRAGLAGLGFEAALAVAATPRAALWLARGKTGTLNELPLEATGIETGFFKSIGLSKIGELLALPREGLGKRCGENLLRQIDQALGALPEPRAFFAPPPRFDATLELPGEVAHAEGVLFAARRLLLQLEGLLAARQAGIRDFVLTLIHPGKKFSEVKIGLSSATRSTARLERLLRERLAAISLREPVAAIRIQAQDFTPLHERTAGMFGDAAADGEEWAQLVERLKARLGGEAVHGLATHPDHRPEYAWRRVEPGEWDPREYRQPGARPLWLLEAPRRLAQMDWSLLAGPERIECGWWDGDEARRDYFIAQAADASLVWIYRDSDAWYLHGIFA